VRRTHTLAGAALSAALVSWAATPALAADATTCAALTARYETRRVGLEPPQVSAVLFAAAEDGCDALAERVLDAGASVAARDRTGGTALTHAARGGHVASIKLLVARGADVDLRNVEGSTPLFVAVELNRLEAAEALIGLGAKVNLPGRAGVTPLSAAAFNGSARLVEALLVHGADPAARDASGKAAILYAAARGFNPVVMRLLDAGADVNATYGNGLTLLMWAVGYANGVPASDGVALVTQLLGKGAALDVRDDRGRTPLMIAAGLDHDDVADVLLRRGADRTLRDKDGKTAADLATTAALRAKLAGKS